MSADFWVYLIAALIAGTIVWRFARQYEIFLDDAWQRSESFREEIAREEKMAPARPNPAPRPTPPSQPS